MAFDAEAAVDQFWQARQQGEFFPAGWADRLDLEQAYRVQLGIAERRRAAGERQVGWKVDLTDAATRQRFNLDEPIFGCLFDEGLKPSGHAFRPGDLIKPAFEVEICVRLGQALSGEVDAAQVRGALDLCYAALEIVERRGDMAQQTALALADNAQQKAFVLGDPVPVSDELQFDRIGVRVEVNGNTTVRTSSAAVLGNPLNSVAWLPRKLAQFGHTLRPGDLIMTGSLTRQSSLVPGDKIRVDFAGLGTVVASVIAAPPKKRIPTTRP